MIFSQWNPDGGYRYFETAQRHPIGDEVPAKVPATINGIGVPSHDTGVTLPKGARYVGEGDEPIGVITPMRRGGYQTLAGEPTSKEKETSMVVVALFVTGVMLLAGLAGNGRR